jgi:hypothetical protein
VRLFPGHCEALPQKGQPTPNEGPNLLPEQPECALLFGCNSTPPDPPPHTHLCLDGVESAQPGVQPLKGGAAQGGHRQGGQVQQLTGRRELLRQQEVPKGGGWRRRG